MWKILKLTQDLASNYVDFRALIQLNKVAKKERIYFKVVIVQNDKAVYSEIYNIKVLKKVSMFCCKHH